MRAVSVRGRWWLFASLSCLTFGCSGEGGPGETHSTAPCAGTGASEIMACVEQSRYEEDLAAIAKERVPGSPQWQKVQDLCADRFAQLGFQVERFKYATGVDVVGVLPGESDDRVFVSAHYDHIAGCDGADDNASGVAGVLEVARVLSGHSWKRTLAVACWDEEERGLLGSQAYVAQKADHGVVASYVFEMIGYESDEPGSQEVPQGFEIMFPKQYKELVANQSRGDFLAVVPDAKLHDQAASLMAHAADIGLRTTSLELSEANKLAPLFADLRRSDHTPFWTVDEGAMMLTDTANYRNKNYHCMAGPDTVERLNPTFATRVIEATAAAVADSLRGD